MSYLPHKGLGTPKLQFRKRRGTGRREDSQNRQTDSFRPGVPVVLGESGEAGSAPSGDFVGPGIKADVEAEINETERGRDKAPGHNLERERCTKRNLQFRFVMTE